MSAPAVAKSICDMMGELDAIGKARKNQQQGFNFRGIDDIYNELHPLLCKHRLFSVPRVTSVQREERQTKTGGTLMFSIVWMEYDIVSAVDGSVHKVGPVVGEGMDSGDKATNKAMSIAHKYAWIQLLNIPTVDLVDPDHDSPPQSTRAPARQRGEKGEEEHTRQRDAGAPPAEPPAKHNVDLSEIRKKLQVSLQEWFASDKGAAKKAVAFLMPGQSSVGHMPDAQIRAFSMGWWAYRLMEGKEPALTEWMDVNGLAWFDKLDTAGLDKLKKYCEHEAKKQEERKPVSPPTQDANGDDPL